MLGVWGAPWVWLWKALLLGGVDGAKLGLIIDADRERTGSARECFL